MSNPFRVLIVVSAIAAIALAVGFVIIVWVLPYHVYTLGPVVAPFIA